MPESLTRHTCDNWQYITTVHDINNQSNADVPLNNEQNKQTLALKDTKLCKVS